MAPIRANSKQHRPHPYSPDVDVEPEAPAIKADPASPSSKKKSTTTTASKVGKEESDVSPKGKRRVRSEWAPTEDAILLDIMADLVKAGIWESVKADGRLVSRTNAGVKVRAAALLARRRK